MSDITFAARGGTAEIEEGNGFAPKFDKDGLITAICQDHQTGQILMVAYMNEQSLQETLRCGEAVFWSRSRQKYWHKGEESGNVQKVKEILVDCDQDCLIIKVDQIGEAACHTGRRSCFYRNILLDKVNEGEVELNMFNKDLIFDPKEVYGKK